MKRTFDLSSLRWSLSGWTPYMWQLDKDPEHAELRVASAAVPGSVQLALRNAGLLPDWNVGLNSRDCEWVENRHWIYETRLPDEWIEPGRTIRLQCLGLDYSGWVLLNGVEIAAFRGSFRPQNVDLTPHLRTAAKGAGESSAASERVPAQSNTLQIVFDCPPRWLGQFGATSRMREWKPRFNYTWDWTPRLVQIGVWDDLLLEVCGGPAFSDLQSVARAGSADSSGSLYIKAGFDCTPADYRVRLALVGDGGAVREEEVSAAALAAGMVWERLPVSAWWTNGHGTQPLYTLTCTLLDASGAAHDVVERRIGFKDLRWTACAGAPEAADPWLCVLNGKPIFLQGVNWTPIRPNFADVTEEQYRERLTLYRDMGCNLLRVWGGAFLEKEVFYNLCDELGLLVWQEFPLSSSGVDNWPPDDEASLAELVQIARSYVSRRRHHVSLALWCGGNELQDAAGRPVGVGHPLIAHLASVVAEDDPERRFLPTSSSGPRFGAAEAEFGKGLHWDIHGPWKPEGSLHDEWDRYWQGDDALFRSETGAPGASGVDLDPSLPRRVRRRAGHRAEPVLESHGMVD